MPLTEKGIEHIREEAERLYPYPDNENAILGIAYVNGQREAHIAAVTKERERAKDFCNEVKRFMETIPIDNGNVFFTGFDEYRVKIIESIKNYTNE